MAFYITSIKRQKGTDLAPNVVGNFVNNHFWHQKSFVDYQQREPLKFSNFVLHLNSWTHYCAFFGCFGCTVACFPPLRLFSLLCREKQLVQKSTKAYHFYNLSKLNYQSKSTHWIISIQPKKDYWKSWNDAYSNSSFCCYVLKRKKAPNKTILHGVHVCPVFYMSLIGGGQNWLIKLILGLFFIQFWLGGDRWSLTDRRLLTIYWIVP